MKTRTPVIICAAFALIGIAGCATPFRAPPDVTHIKLDRADSPTVSVEKIWLERKNGELVVTGYVIKELGVTDTTQTHLDLTLINANGQVLRSSVEYFAPRQIPAGHRMHGHAQYRIVLDPLPPDTAQIRVAAHEGTHPPER